MDYLTPADVPEAAAMKGAGAWVLGGVNRSSIPCMSERPFAGPVVDIAELAELRRIQRSRTTCGSGR